MAEPELSVLTRQCLGEQINSIDAVLRESTAWTRDRNRKQTGVEWHFTTENARIKLRHLYPKIET